MNSSPNRQPARRGLFIVFEGIDRAGKTTQIARLSDRLALVQKVAVQSIRFPDNSSTVGLMLRSSLSSAAAAGRSSQMNARSTHLLFSANRWELAPLIESLLAQGITVLCDRYAHSGVAHGIANGLPRDWCAASDQGLPAPDVVIQLDIDSMLSAARADIGAVKPEDVNLLEDVRNAYTQIARLVTQFPWISIDARGDEREVADRVYRSVEHMFRGAPPNPVQRLYIDV